MREECQSTNSLLRYNVLAAYWLNYNRGNVRMFTHTKRNRILAPRDLRTIANDLSKAFGSGAVKHFDTFAPFIDIMERPRFNHGNIEKVIVITWENMHFTGNTKTRLVSMLLIQGKWRRGFYKSGSRDAANTAKSKRYHPNYAYSLVNFERSISCPSVYNSIYIYNFFSFTDTP